ncbi:hypothetical protein AAHE18_16G224800 [Arachis hypogaea]
MTTSSLPRLLSTVPNPAPYLTRSEPLTRSISNSVSRLLCSYSTQQPRENTVTEQEHAPSLSHKEESMRTEEQEQEQEQQHDDDDEDGELVNDETGEVGGPKGPEPTRYGDWEHESQEMVRRILSYQFRASCRIEGIMLELKVL